MNAGSAEQNQIANCLENIVESLGDNVLLTENLLQDSLSGPLSILPQVANHLVGAGGKRIRPLLCLLSAQASGVPMKLAVRAAAASELIHSASLFHDDVVDETPLRRGRVAAPREYGNSICVLVGDALMAKALMLLSGLEQHAPLSSLARCVRRMALGEIRQLQQAGRPHEQLLSYLRIVEGKTSALFAWCATVGDLASTPNLNLALAKYGRRLGMAFQITDDILDFAGQPQETGKSIGTDLQEGKFTLPLHYACQANPNLKETLLGYYRQDKYLDEELVQWVIREVRQSGGLAQATNVADTLLRHAHHALKDLSPSSWRDQLHLLADFVVRRKQ